MNDNRNSHTVIRSYVEERAALTEETLRKLMPGPELTRRAPRIPRRRDPFWQGVVFLVLSVALLLLVARCSNVLAG